MRSLALKPNVIRSRQFGTTSTRQQLTTTHLYISGGRRAHLGPASPPQISAAARQSLASVPPLIVLCSLLRLILLRGLCSSLGQPLTGAASKDGPDETKELGQQSASPRTATAHTDGAPSKTIQVGAAAPAA